MKTSIKTISTFVASAIWTDGIYDEGEKDILSVIADALYIEESQFVSNVEAELNAINTKSEEEINNILIAEGKNVNSEEKGMLFEAVLEVILSDGKVSRDEVSNLMAIAEYISLPEEDAILLLADLVKEDPDTEIIF